jgi:hypothetical protein
VKTKLINSVILCTLILLFPVLANQITTDLRGQVVAYNSYSGSTTPAFGVMVILLIYDPITQNMLKVQSTLTNASGMYYLYDILPGNYYLSINNQLYSLKVLAIDKSFQQFQDIPRIRI